MFAITQFKIIMGSWLHGHSIAFFFLSNSLPVPSSSSPIAFSVLVDSICSICSSSRYGRECLHLLELVGHVHGISLFLSLHLLPLLLTPLFVPLDCYRIKVHPSPCLFIIFFVFCLTPMRDCIQYLSL